MPAGLLKDRDYGILVERLLFALVANRALAPASKLAMEDWVGGEVHVPGLETVEVHQLYRATDFLYESVREIERSVYLSVANLFNLEVDVLFFDTTTTYFEIEGEGDAEGLRQRGYSKDDRPGLAQAVIGFAVTRDGIPVRSWVWPGKAGRAASHRVGRPRVTVKAGWRLTPPAFWSLRASAPPQGLAAYI